MKRNYITLPALFLLIPMLVATALIPSSVETSATDRTVIIVDAGHGGADGGASFGSVEEKALNLHVSLLLRDFLEMYGYTVRMTRETDCDTDGRDGFHKAEDLSNRVAMAEDLCADLFVSVHMNASTSSADKGFQVFYGRKDPQSKALASAIVQTYASSLSKTRVRAVAQSPDTVWIMKQLSVPSVLVECGFISNAEDLALLSDTDYQTELALCLARGIYEFLQGSSLD